MRISDWSSDVCSSDLHFDRQKTKGSNLEGTVLYFNQPDPRNTRILDRRKHVGELPDDGFLYPGSGEYVHMACLVVVKSPDVINSRQVIFVFMGKYNSIKLFRPEEHQTELQSLMRIP